MGRYKIGKRKHFIPRRVWGLLICLVILAVAATIIARHIYYTDLQPVNSNDQKSQIFTVNEGSSVTQIGDQLESNHLIRSAWAFELYAHAHDLSDSLQAGTYALSPSYSLPSIVNTVTQGKVATKLVTILPGKRIDQIRADLINDGFSPASVDNALNPANYVGLPALAFKPADVNSLEGLLWPNSYQKDPNTSPSVIIRESLTEMGQRLTPAVQAAFAGEGLTTYQGITLTSIILQEVSKYSDQTQVAQVFLSRLKTGMPLGSDVTAYYGSIEAGQSPSLTYNSPYNTLINKGLPPGPISNIDSSALYAATHPDSTSWLYFVTGDNGTTYFSNNLAQQQVNTAQYCHKLCGQ
jgi:peptidoglycan lytic transglycosylase G